MLTGEAMSAALHFERHGNVKFGAPTRTHDKKMISNEGKMEKSFLNFKATNPDWTPTDPSGSLYLSRMADLNAHRPLSHSRRRHGQGSAAGSDVGGTVHFANDPQLENSAMHQAHDYDQALRQSRLAAVSRRRGPGSVMGMSGLLAPHGSMGIGAASVYADINMAPSAVLGDSQGSEQLEAASTSMSRAKNNSGIPADNMGPDGGVGSGLGESYVDGGRRYGGKEEEEEDLEDGGVLGLLAQIYGRRDGPAVAM
ncbi:hypothetical protein B0H34DRAFT_322148 [Crassisporium funariophilum]|nr:hypothetical protein B0H34DRAFT_322148 [Crassisporium funariophilum]